MLSYASRTGTRRNLAALRANGWRLLVSAAACLRTEGFPYCLDNGAWSYHQQGVCFDARAFRIALRKLGRDSDFVVVPDIVCGWPQTVDFSRQWLNEVLDYAPKALFAVQNGMQESDIGDLLGPRVGIFVGGDTGWKLATMSEWGRVARKYGAHLHVARVNTARRILLCAEAGADSFDGSSASRYSVTTVPLSRARDQRPLFCATGKER